MTVSPLVSKSSPPRTITWLLTCDAPTLGGVSITTGAGVTVTVRRLHGPGDVLDLGTM